MDGSGSLLGGSWASLGWLLGTLGQLLGSLGRFLVALGHFLGPRGQSAGLLGLILAPRNAPSLDFIRVRDVLSEVLESFRGMFWHAFFCAASRFVT